ncbi:hypothetical protein JYB62_04300 [Algoriphagus lutimaris]|uniref:hypothetical protein n=1 Tax=Algoriphagus lutimaris TaxID=613197 RepID=UPI00196A583D|nr:hypothetical protein [Algoriphagus lutimaris]MBN3519214.1 hypothetical protein [Algoriphagus lutimaris]
MTWLIEIPSSNTFDSLILEFNELLDYPLLNEIFSIKGENDSSIKGEFEIGIHEKSIRFGPNISWKPGEYCIQIESRLEDLGGNNLNRLFEKDLVDAKRLLTEETPFKVI